MFIFVENSVFFRYSRVIFNVKTHVKNLNSYFREFRNKRPSLINAPPNKLICKHTVDDNSHFILNCPSFKDYFALLWHKLKVKVHKSNPVDGSLTSNFVDNLDQHSKMLLLLGGLPLPFDQMTVHTMRRFITSDVAEIYNIRTERLRELEALWLSD